jgi:hypothetical protein
MQGDTKAALAFLQEAQPGGPWALTSIEPDRKGIQTKTFGPRSLKEMEEWLNQFNGKRTLYFHVNKVGRPITKKAEREDIEEMRYLHVDLDPRAGEDFTKERERILARLESPPEGLPTPTYIIDSGGGYQGLWLLEEPIHIGGELAKAEEAKRYNQQLELTFGADHCHNIDRLLRLPGTINVPDSKKKAKGRVEALASLAGGTGEAVSLTLFRPAPLVQAAGAGGFSGGTVQVSGNVERLASVDELPPNVPDWVKVLIVQGEDPDNPGKYSSRSEAVFAVCCELIRCNVDPNVIFAVLTDPDFAIASSILEKKSAAERYALRQIERAKEHAINPALREMNEKHAVISDVGGRCVVVSETYDSVLNRTKLSRQGFDHFRNRYMNKQVQVGTDKDGNPVFKAKGAWWLLHPNRRQYENIVFAPGQEVIGSYNLWRGFSVEAQAGDCSLFLQLVRDVICGGDERLNDYVLNWCARAVQEPASNGQVALVLRSGEGTGKGTFAKEFGKLFGSHFIQVSNSNHLVGNFNAHLRDCVVLFADEAFFAGDKKHESVLKTLITEETIPYEHKGVDIEVGPNYTHVIMASNDAWVVPAGADARRYLVLDVAEVQKQRGEYFKAIRNQMQNGGRAALLHFLLTRDITGYDVSAVPKTKGLMDQKLFTMSPEEEWWHNKLEDGLLLPSHDRWEREVMKDELFNDYVNHMQRTGILRRCTPTMLKSFLSRVLPRPYPIQSQRWAEITIKGAKGEMRVRRRPYFFEMPSIEDARAMWTERLGGEYKWTELADEGPAPERVKEPLPF